MSDLALIDATATAGRPHQTVLLNWTSSGPAGAGSAGPPRPCTLCGRPAICRSPRGIAVHKVCAEGYAARGVSAA